MPLIDRKSQRATPRSRYGIRREAITRKYAYVHDDALIPDPHAKEKVMKIPARPRGGTSPAPSSKRASLLPTNATWGMNAKAQRLAGWVCTRDSEILNESGSKETLPSKAQLQTKTGGLYGGVDRSDKIKHRSLARKYWINRTKARRYALALEERARVSNGGDDDDDDDNGGGGGGGAGEIKEPRARPSPYWAKRQEKKRREERRAARDRKCFDPSAELDLPFDPAPPPKSYQKKSHQKKVVPLLLTPELLAPLLSSESSGPPVSDLFSSGMTLSNEAANDLKLMLAGQVTARALAKAARSPPALKICFAKDPRGRSLGRAEGKIPSPSKAYPKKPAFDIERGKRRC